jgi:hypothetical protein
MRLKKIWLVPHPTSQFNEDVKELAVNKGLRIIDAKFKGEIGKDFIEANPPELTKVKKEVKKEVKK